eukprot:COSAG05_NODE_27450_length_153_cov_147.333333_1_plen_27_part_01
MVARGGNTVIVCKSAVLGSSCMLGDHI